MRTLMTTEERCENGAVYALQITAHVDWEWTSVCGKHLEEVCWTLTEQILSMKKTIVANGFGQCSWIEKETVNIETTKNHPKEVKR